MNEQNYNPNNSNWNMPSSTGSSDQKLPNSNGSFVLGIISLCVSTVCCCCYGSFAGVVTSIIGIVLGSKAIRTYQENPGMYSEKTYKKAKSGRTMSWIGLIISVLGCITLIVYLYLAVTNQLPPELQDQFEDNKRKWDFD
jgi:hypothetical protein